MARSSKAAKGARSGKAAKRAKPAKPAQRTGAAKAPRATKKAKPARAGKSAKPARAARPKRAAAGNGSAGAAPDLRNGPLPGDVRVPPAGPVEPRSPLTLYDAAAQTGYAAVIAHPDGRADEPRLKAAAALAKAGSLPDGAPLLAVHLIVPIRASAVALSERARGMGIARVLYGDYWDPCPPPPPRGTLPAPPPARLTYGPGGAAGIHRLDLGSGVAMEMTFIPAGAFLMGSDTDSADEAPRHSHEIPRGYFIGRDAVTWGQYRAFCRATGRAEPPAPGSQETHAKDGYEVRDDLPVVNVSWEDARAFCEWAGLALPTEAEWEKAARGTDGRRYPWGDLALELARPTDLTVIYENPQYGGRTPAPAGACPADLSPYGCRDMAGNVMEWTADWHAADTYARCVAGEAATPASGQARVSRGASYETPSVFARACVRMAWEPGHRAKSLGFRAVLRVQ